VDQVSFYSDKLGAEFVVNDLIIVVFTGMLERRDNVWFSLVQFKVGSLTLVFPDVTLMEYNYGILIKTRLVNRGLWRSVWYNVYTYRAIVAWGTDAFLFEGETDAYLNRACFRVLVNLLHSEHNSELETDLVFAPICSAKVMWRYFTNTSFKAAAFIRWRGIVRAFEYYLAYKLWLWSVNLLFT
jgi:hypothetical protein